MFFCRGARQFLCLQKGRWNGGDIRYNAAIRGIRGKSRTVRASGMMPMGNECCLGKGLTLQRPFRQAEQLPLCSGQRSLDQSAGCSHMREERAPCLKPQSFNIALTQLRALSVRGKPKYGIMQAMASTRFCLDVPMLAFPWM